MEFADIFDSEVVNYQAKDNRTPNMAPEARGGRTLILVVFLETFLRRMLARTTNCGSP